MIPIRKMAAEMKSYPIHNATTKNETPKNTATAEIHLTKWVTSFDIGVSKLSNPEAKPAILPIKVPSPTATTMPLAVP